MKSGQYTTSAALFYPSEHRDPVPVAWFERAIELFHDHQLSPILFTAGGGPFELDDCYRLADGDGKEFRWDDPAPIYPRRSALAGALRKGEVYDLGMDAPRANGRDRSDWRADLTASSIGGEIYIGLDEELVDDPTVLIRRACQMAQGLFDIRYGFAYKMPLADDPASYASGSRSLSLAGFKDLMRRKREGIRPKLTADELWNDELRKDRRHLPGFFRGVYPANVLSAAHVEAAGLRSSSVGRLSEIDDSLWLWEVSEAEIPIAETLLLAKRLLVRQIAEP